MIKFKIGDTVKITAGKDKGREGKIEKVIPSALKVIVPGVDHGDGVLPVMLQGIQFLYNLKESDRY